MSIPPPGTHCSFGFIELMVGPDHRVVEAVCDTCLDSSPVGHSRLEAQRWIEAHIEAFASDPAVSRSLALGAVR